MLSEDNKMIEISLEEFKNRLERLHSGIESYVCCYSPSCSSLKTSTLLGCLEELDTLIIPGVIEPGVNGVVISQYVVAGKLLISALKTKALLEVWKPLHKSYVVSYRGLKFALGEPDDITLRLMALVDKPKEENTDMTLTKEDVIKLIEDRFAKEKEMADRLTKEDIRKILSEAQSKDKRANLIELNLEGLELRGVDFEKVDLVEANLKDTDLEYSFLSNANLYKANLEGVNLKGADLEWTKLQYTNFKNANLCKANFFYATVSFTNFENANLEYAYFGNVSEHQLATCNFKGVNVKGTMLEGKINKDGYYVE